MLNELKDVLELATNATSFVKTILELKPTKKNNDNNAIISTEGDWARIGSSGYGAKIGSCGDGAKIGSCGDGARIGSCGYGARIEVNGKNSIAAAIGYKSIAKGCKGTWLTLAEYDGDGVISFVKTEQIDGESLKENTFYTLYNKTFQEVEIIDEISTIILKRRNNVIKGISLNDYSPCYVFTKDGIYAHGNTVRQAYLDWIFKTSDRDVSKYQNISKNEIHPLDFWVVAYRKITDACSFGTNDYLEHNKDKYKPEMTLEEVIKATEGQYGAQTFKEFFEKKE